MVEEADNEADDEEQADEEQAAGGLGSSRATAAHTTGTVVCVASELSTTASN